MGEAGETLGKHKLVYLDNMGLWRLADTDSATKMPTLGITLGIITIGRRGRILTYGYVGDASWTWTPGGTIYASATAGELTQTVPTTGWIQAMGVARSSDYMFLIPTWIKEIDETRTHSEHIPAGKFGRPNTNPPDVVTVDNTLLLEFDVDTDIVHYKWMVSEHYVSGTDLTITFHWTNDGGTDDNGKNVKIELSYLPVSDGDVLSGSHANSARHIDDAYTSDLGSVFHTTDVITIPAADFAGKHEIQMKFMFVTADATALAGKPRMDAMMITHTEYIYL